jgi:hypothetical protein
MLEILYEAMAEEIGLVVSTSDPVRLRNEFYKVRKHDPIFQNLSFFISPINPTSELWIAKIDGEI